MKAYHIFFIVLRVAIMAQFALVILNRHSVGSKIYILTNIIFKLSLGIFVQIYMFNDAVSGIPIEDKIVISFAGGLLIFDAISNDLPDLLRIYGIHVFDSAKTKNLIYN
jgi:hypothetical protein